MPARPSTARRGALALALVAAAAVVATAVPGPAVATTPVAEEVDAMQWERYVPANTGIPGDYVYDLAIDKKNRLWVTSDDPVWDEGGLGMRADGSKGYGKPWKSWTNVDGTAPTHAMSTITFRDGTQYLSSGAGLLRRDGDRVRTVWSKADVPSWPAAGVADFDWDSAGNLWVALADVSTVKGGVARYDGTSWKVWTTRTGLPWKRDWDQVSQLEIDDDDNVWIGSPTQGGAMFDGTTWSALGKGSGTWVVDIEIDRDGTPWYGFSATGVQTWDGRRWVDRTGASFGSRDVGAVETDREGRIWVASYDGRIWRWSGAGSSWDLSYDPPSLGAHLYTLGFDRKNQPYVGGIGGVAVRRTDGAWIALTTQSTGLPNRFADHVMVDDEGRGWVSTFGGGIGMVDAKGRRWAGFNPNNWGSEDWPFSTDSVTSTASAPDGTVWATPTNDGVGSWDGETWTEHFSDWVFEDVEVDAGGGVWAIPNHGEIKRFDGTTWKGMANPTGAADLYEAAADADGNVWIGTRIGLFKHDGKRWTSWTAASSGLPDDWVNAVAVDADGVVWVGTPLGVARFDGTTWTTYDESDGLPADFVNAIDVAPDGDVWVGAFDGSVWPYHGGLARFDSTRWTSFTTATSPLPHNQVESVTVGADGRVWAVAASQGVVVITP